MQEIMILKKDTTHYLDITAANVGNDGSHTPCEEGRSDR